MIVKLCTTCTHTICNHTLYEKHILHMRLVYYKIIKHDRDNVKHSYVMQGRQIVQEIVIIIHKLNLMYKYNNTVYQTSV